MTSTSPGQLKAEMRDGRFVRQANAFTDRVTADGGGGYRAEPGRYHLYVSLACPWAHRSIIVRELLGLGDVISMSLVDPIRDERGWAFRGPYTDPVNGFDFLSQAYEATDPDFSGRWTVPCLWDRRAGRLVSNDYPQLTLMMETEFTAFHRPDAPDLYPEALRGEIDELSAFLFERVNNAVYRTGFATTQAVYDEEVEGLFAALDELEARLSTRRFLLGAALTEADVRLYTTLARFDAAYHGHFKCNLRRLVDYPNLWGYARDLYARPGFGDTTDFDQIKRHYYATHERINPTRIVPKGPLSDWGEAHGRERLP